MAAKKGTKTRSKAASAPSQSAPLNFTQEHVKLAREGKSKEIFDRLLNRRPSDDDSKEKQRY